MFDCLTETQTRILIACIGTFTTIAGYFIGHYLGKRSIRYKNFLVVSDTFRNAFIDIQVFLEESDKSTVFEKIETINIKVSDFIENQIKIQERAFIVLSPHLGFFKKKRLRKTWKDYANPKEKNKKTRFSETSASLNRYVAYNSVNDVEEREIRNLVKDRINKLLRYAKTK